MTERIHYAIQQWKHGGWKHVGVHQKNQKEAKTELLRIRALVGPSAILRIEPQRERSRV